MTPSQYLQRLERLEQAAQRKPLGLQHMTDAEICHAMRWPLDISDAELQRIIAEASA